jgi:hypothetical protein
MFCPQCRAEFRPGFTRCSDCDVELVENYMETVHHPTAKKVAVSDQYDAQLWSGTDPHLYVALLGSLWNKKVACYGVPRYPPIPDSVGGQQPDATEPGGFEVWVSEQKLPLARWILDSSCEEFDKARHQQHLAKANVGLRELSPETNGVCPLCFGEFTTASSYCPNCGVPLRSPGMGTEDSARTLCDLGHPKFITELRKALQAAGIAFNNSNLFSADIFAGRFHIPNCELVVLEQDFERATQVMSQVFQRWEFEPSAGFGINRDLLPSYWPVRATDNNWFVEDVSALVWSGENLGLLGAIGRGLQEHEIPYRAETEQWGSAKLFSHPEDEARAREIIREVVEGPPPE